MLTRWNHYGKKKVEGGIKARKTERPTQLFFQKSLCWAGMGWQFKNKKYLTIILDTCTPTFLCGVKLSGNCWLRRFLKGQKKEGGLFIKSRMNESPIYLLYVFQLLMNFFLWWFKYNASLFTRFQLWKLVNIMKTYRSCFEYRTRDAWNENTVIHAHRTLSCLSFSLDFRENLQWRKY